MLKIKKDNPQSKLFKIGRIIKLYRMLHKTESIHNCSSETTRYTNEYDLRSPLSETIEALLNRISVEELFFSQIIHVIRTSPF